jgi:hypothetical protein
VNAYPRVVLRAAGGRKLGIDKYRCDVRATAAARLAQVKTPRSSSVISVHLPHYADLDYCPAQAAGIGVDVSSLEPSLRALRAHP